MCRGELLDALRESGVTVRGVDVSPAMVELCRGRGFEVALGDALTYVSSQPDGSLGGLIAIQVVARYVFSEPPGWTEEGARYAMVWSGLLGTR